MPVEIVRGDITTLEVHAIVNAANKWLRGGGGVDGAIHRAAGPRLMEACRALPADADGVRCPPGEARITPGFDLPARYVIHTVGPVWNGGGDGEEETLRRCYISCLDLAAAHGVESIAFPCISTGVYGFPVRRAAEIAVGVLGGTDEGKPQRIIVCCFDGENERAYRDVLGA